MKNNTKIAIGVFVAALLAAIAGYWVGQWVATDTTTSGAMSGDASGEGAKKGRKPLYYRNPMGLPDISPIPKKDQMGMDYIPVYEDEGDGEATSSNQIKISVGKIQKLGVRTETATTRRLDRIVRASGRVEMDERKTFTISPKFEGYVERLHVNITGQKVYKGQALFEVYSPELVSAQQEYQIAAQGIQSLKDGSIEAQAGMQQLADSSLLRLRSWDISEDQIKALAKSGLTKRTLTFRSPVNGVVTEKKAMQGMRFLPGETLYQVADLSSVWILADVFEQDIGQVKAGALAKIKISAYPSKIFEGEITYVYPVLNEATRTVPVRIELSNPGQLLKPAMFAQVELPVGGDKEVLTVPESAVIDSGTRRIVLVQLGEGRFEPRHVKLGARSDKYVEVLEGIKEGEQVVVSANFLIDAESNLQAVFKNMVSHGEKDDASPDKKSVTAGHKADGSVESIDANDGTLSIKHEPIETLKWPAMTMEFKVANHSLLKGVEPGLAVEFEFVERQPGEWVITNIKPKTGVAAPDGR